MSSEPMGDHVSQRPGPIFAALRQALKDEALVALATVTAVEAGATQDDGAQVITAGLGAAFGTGGDPVGEASIPGDLPSLPRSRVGAKLLVRPSADEVVLGTLGDADLDRVVSRDVLAAIERGVTVTRHYGARGEARQRAVEVFIEVFAPPPVLVIFGAVDFTASLVTAGRLLGFRVIVCDARPVFATRARFPMADEVVVDWPDRYLATIGGSLGPRDAVCVLTHDTKFDVPAIIAALRTRVGYLGAMGSRRTHEERWRRLIEAGADEGMLAARLMSPIGLDIGARTPEETAIAICAEIIACRRGVNVPSLRARRGPIHTR